MGQVAALNCGAGDIRVTFEKGNVFETERAKGVIQDMLKRGYALFVDEGDGKFVKASRFDPEKEVYIIGNGPLAEDDQAETDAAVADAKASTIGADMGQPRRGRPPGAKNKSSRAVSMHKGKAVGVAPTAGG